MIALGEEGSVAPVTCARVCILDKYGRCGVQVELGKTGACDFVGYIIQAITFAPLFSDCSVMSSQAHFGLPQPKLQASSVGYVV